MHRVIFCLHDKAWRGFVGGIDVGVGRHILCGIGKVSGIDDERKVRTAAELVCRIDGIIKALVEMSAQRSGQMRSRRKAKNAYPVGIDVPFGCMLTSHAECALRILQGGR